MKECCEKIRSWTDRLASSKMDGWDELPDLDLYMDQVLTILEKQAEAYLQAEDIKAITPSMINNYVKDGTIQHPVKKKYGKDHIANLIMLNSAKQVLPIADISSLLNRASGEISTGEKYEYFTLIHKKACEAVTEKIHDALDRVGDQCDSKQLFILATSMVLEADLMVSASKMLIRDVLVRKEVDEAKSKLKAKAKPKPLTKKP